MDDRLPRSFFARPTLTVARELLGKSLVKVEADGEVVSGIIVETEAYIGSEDLACHARSGRTKRNDSLWGTPGCAYVYFTYGMHWLFNIVTERDGFPAAVLIRGLNPERGVARMERRRGLKNGPTLTNGPAKLCQALGIGEEFDGHDVCARDSRIYVESRPAVDEARILTGPRVGINNVPEPWKSLPWRFWLNSTQK